MERERRDALIVFTIAGAGDRTRPTGEGRSHRAPVRLDRTLVGTVLVMAALLVIGCRPGDVAEEPREAEGPAVGIPLEVVRGPQGSVLTFVDVFFGDEGPYVFVVDTGASRSVIAPDLVQTLNLESAGDAGEVSGVTGTQRAQLVEVENWRIGDVELPSMTIVSMALPDIGGPTRLMELLGFEALANMKGLLGSDVLAEFGQISIDYEQEVLQLRSDQPPGSQ